MFHMLHKAHNTHCYEQGHSVGMILMRDTETQGWITKPYCTSLFQGIKGRDKSLECLIGLEMQSNKVVMSKNNCVF